MRGTLKDPDTSNSQGRTKVTNGHAAKRTVPNRLPMPRTPASEEQVWKTRRAPQARAPQGLRCRSKKADPRRPQGQHTWF